MHRVFAFAFVFVFVAAFLAPSDARAAETAPNEVDDDDDPSDDGRPVRYASVELNALGPAVDRYGGHLQVALMGPLTLVGGVSRIENGALRGWAAEVGSRLFFGLAPRRSDGMRIAHVFLAASYLVDDLHVGDTRGERRGVALDAGVHVRLRHGFYALGGIGIAHRSTDIVIPDRLERMTTTPRLLFAVGWGF